MAFDLNDFKSQGLVGGGARPSLFEVRLTAPPTGVTMEGGTTSTSKLSFLCQAASLPSATMNLVEVPYFGRRVKIAGERIFRDWTVTVMNDEDFSLKDMFEQWSNKINTLETNIQNSTSSLLDYKINTCEVLQYGKAGPYAAASSGTTGGSGSDAAILRAYVFYGLFPIDVGTVQLDWSRGNNIETFDVTFAYDYWLPSSASSATGTQGSTSVGYSGQEVGAST